MEQLESILHVLGRDRARLPHSPGWCWKAQCGPKTSDLLPCSPCPAQKCGTDCLEAGLLCYLLQELRLRGRKERGPHVCHSHFPQKSMLLASSLPEPLPPALAGIQGLSPGAPQTLAPGLRGVGLVRGMGRRAEVCMLLQAVSSVLELRFRLPEEFPQYPRKLRALVDVLVPVAEV